MYTMDHIFGYRSRKSYAHARNRLRMLTVPKSEAEILNSLKLPEDLQGNGQFATDSQGCLQTSDEDPRTGTFPQMRSTMGDTTCSVKGVLKLKEGSCDFLLGKTSNFRCRMSHKHQKIGLNRATTYIFLNFKVNNG